mmetsp:Transcript_10324/g.39080  ORF Transcript_10324/g.39080 Transcript_10324/m.39080 type:complete len:411 (-) Transcript_10324:147-1379(-)
MEPCFILDDRYHGVGPVLFRWHPRGTCLATAGSNRKVQIFSREGYLLSTPVPTASSACTDLAWSYGGKTLAIGQANSSVVLLYDYESQTARELDVGIKEVSLLLWSKADNILAIGTSKGVLFIYDMDTDMKITARGKHKRRIISADWLGASSLAYASEDKQITMCTSAGIMLDQVKVKCRPLNVAFGGKEFDENSIVSVNMEGKTILLYNATEKDNALELAFQAKYGNIMAYTWFADGYIMAAFSSGFVVVISTRVNEIGREQFCARFLKDSEGRLNDLAHCARTERVACIGDNCIKVVNMQDWTELTAQHLQKEETGKLDHVAWDEEGDILTVSSEEGTIYSFRIKSSTNEVRNLKNTLSMAVMEAYSIDGFLFGAFVVCSIGAVGAAVYFKVSILTLLREAFMPTATF